MQKSGSTGLSVDEESINMAQAKAPEIKTKGYRNVEMTGKKHTYGLRLRTRGGAVIQKRSSSNHKKSH